MTDRFQFAVETVFDWADEREVGVRLRRNDDLMWEVRLSFGDVYGRFVEDVPLSIPTSGAEAGRRYVEDFRDKLDKACARRRKARIDEVKRRLH